MAAKVSPVKALDEKFPQNRLPTLRLTSFFHYQSNSLHLRSKESMKGKNYTLAVFDSDRAMLNACALILKEQDINVHAFANSGNFAEQLRHSSPSAILLDNSIVPHGGLEVLRSLKQHHQLHTIPVIYMTGNGAIGDKALKEGAQYLLLKPFDLAQLTAAVLRACEAGH